MREAQLVDVYPIWLRERKHHRTDDVADGEHRAFRRHFSPKVGGGD